MLPLTLSCHLASCKQGFLLGCSSSSAHCSKDVKQRKCLLLEAFSKSLVNCCRVLGLAISRGIQGISWLQIALPATSPFEAVIKSPAGHSQCRGSGNKQAQESHIIWVVFCSLMQKRVWPVLCAICPRQAEEPRCKQQ